MNPTTPPGASVRTRPRRSLAFQLAAVALVVVSALAATGLAWWLRPHAAQQNGDKKPAPNRLFDGWEKPDFVVVLSGQQHGYVQPCGCSEPQVGGLERRYNFLQQLEAKGWPIVAVDLGGIPQKTGPAGLTNQQGVIKHLYSMRALKAMGYSIVGFDDYEANLGLPTLLGQFALNDDPKVVATNLMDADKNFPVEIVPWKKIDVTDARKQNVRLGVVAITDPIMAARIKALDPKLRFGETKLTLDNVGKQLSDGQVELPILLYQGPVTREDLKESSTGAVACAEAYPEYPLILCHSEHDDPSMEPMKVKTKAGTESLLMTVGHKGKFIGVVGVWRTGKKESPFRFRYQRVELTEDYKTPKGKEKGHPIVALMEEYTQELRDKKYLERYGQLRHPLQMEPPVKGLAKPGEAVYAGSESCKKCHQHAYDVWKKTPHSHAYQTLVNAKQPSNRQYDPECVVCHTVGFGYKSGYVSEGDWERRKKKARDEGLKDPPDLRDVGCESCHGPSSVHVANPYNAQWQRHVNPWRFMAKKDKALKIDQMCQKCHDQDNDVTWLNKGFERKWPKIDHVTVPQEEDEDEKKP